jgi:hypothetical protein
MGRITDAAAALRSVAPDMNDATEQMLLGQVRVESDFGYLLTTPDGSPSHNWGNIYTNGDRGTIKADDTYEGKPITVGAAWNSSAIVGARQFYNLIRGSYSPALAAAAAGDAFVYSVALWRDGPMAAPWTRKQGHRPSYYTGFPPGHKWSLAPKGTRAGSDVDAYYRILAYAKYIDSGARQVASALGKPLSVRVNAPPPPVSGGGGGGGGGGAGAGGIVAAAFVVGGLALLFGGR